MWIARLDAHILVSCLFPSKKGGKWQQQKRFCFYQLTVDRHCGMVPWGPRWVGSESSPILLLLCPFLQRAWRNQTGREGTVCVYVLGLLSKKTTPEVASALSKSWSIANGWAPALSAEARKMQQKGRWIRRLIWFKSPLCCWPIAGHVTSLLRCKRGFFTHCWVLPLQKNMWAFFFVFLLNSSSLTLSI